MTTLADAFTITASRDDIDGRLLGALIVAALRDRADDEDRLAGMVALIGHLLVATDDPNATMRMVISALSAEHQLV